jgi:hypothetical protein
MASLRFITNGSTPDHELKSEYQESKLAVNSTKVMEPSAFLVKLDREADVRLPFHDARGGPCNSEAFLGHSNTWTTMLRNSPTGSKARYIRHLPPDQ